MKYVLAWKPRLNGHGEANQSDFARVLEAYGKWTPSEDVTFIEFLQRLDAEGGIAVVEAKTPHAMLAETTKFAPWFECEVTPVVDFREGVEHFEKSVAFHGSVQS